MDKRLDFSQTLTLLISHYIYTVAKWVLNFMQGFQETKKYACSQRMFITQYGKLSTSTQT